MCGWPWVQPKGPAPGPAQGPYHHLKEDIKSFQKKKVYQNWTIIKEVTSKLVIGNVLVSLVVVGSKKCTFSARARARDRSHTGALVQARSASNFLNNSPILINFFLFESS